MTGRGIFLSRLWRNFCRKDVDSPWSWLVCCCATIIIAMFFGISLNFGILFPVLMDYFQETRERTAWVGSVGIACTFTFGPLTSALVNRLGCRRTAIFGALLCTASLLLSSLPSNIAVLYVTYSIPFGLGSGCLFVSCYVVTSLYFDRRRSLATGIIASGTGLGVLAVAPLLQALLDSFDWRKTYRIMGGMFSIVLLLCLTFDPVLLKRKVNEMEEENEREAEILPVDRQNEDQGEKRNKLLNLSIFKEKTFVVLTLAFAFALLGHHTPRLHLVKFAEDLQVSANVASRLFIYIGITSFIGRLFSGFLCNIRRINSFYVFMFGLILDGLSVVFLSQAANYQHLIVFSFIYGLADGFVIGTFNILILYCVEPSKRASAFGVSALFYGITTATGPPLAGFMTDHLKTYVPSFILAAVVEFLGAALVLLIICAKTTSQSTKSTESAQGGVMCELEETNENDVNEEYSKVVLHDKILESRLA